ENFPKIFKLAKGLAGIGKAYGATVGQVSIAWLRRYHSHPRNHQDQGAQFLSHRPS
ncbi:hypothetical protein FIBSPDRAFT_754387, partial [Athelia psychrophila]